MPSRKDGRIEPGQKLSTAISARAWNRAQQAADVVLGVQPEIGAGSLPGPFRPYTWVYFKPSVTVARWGVLAITGMEIAPTSEDGDATASFEESPVLTGGTPSSATAAWCVAIEPIEQGNIGRVAVAGVVQCKASIGNESHKFVRAKASTSELESAWSGEGLILWKGNGWALVRLGVLDLTKYESYDATKQQVFGHAANGSPEWLDTTDCEA